MLAAWPALIYLGGFLFVTIPTLNLSAAMSQMDDENRPERKRRTREHVIADLGENHLERKVLLRGHLLRRPERDYGVDATMFHFAENGEIENGEVRFQLKSTDELKIIKRGTTISYPIKTGDLHYWSLELYPFMLIVFDAANEKAFWLDVQRYVRENPDALNPDNQTVNVHIPVSNTLTVRSIDSFRRMSLEMIAKLRKHGGFPDGRRMPK